MRGVIALILVTGVSALLEEQCHGLFEGFKGKFAKKYASTEHESYRRSVFCESMKRADAKNKLNGSPVFGVTKFSDMTFEEYSVLLGRKNRGHHPSKFTVRNPSLTAASSDAINWADLGKVTPVKNQGQCGSCWAFSAAEAVESAWMMAGNAIWEFSPQQIASCTPGCFGCGGGDTTAAYEYINSTVGLGSAWFAPYVQSMYEQCTRKKCTEACSSIPVADLPSEAMYTGPYATVSGYDYATPPCTGSCANQDLNTLASNILQNGPASICINAANWNDYTGGVMSVEACGGFAYKDLDHCVALTGFNSTGNYWLVKNNWATNWGENGYIRLQFDANTCGIANEATYAILGNA